MTSPSSPQSQSKVGYLFGHPIAHSLSPILHQLVYKHLSLPYTYTLYESTSIPAFLALTRAPDFYGAAVTMPYKVSIIPHLHALTPEGAAIGAVNTIFLAADRQLHGTNTDCIGIREALRQNMPPERFALCRGRPALVVGGGGTSRAAVYALAEWIGSGPIYMLNRDASEVEAVMAECTARGFGSGLVHVSSLAQARSLDTPAVIVSAIPDFPPQTEGEVLVRDGLTAILEKSAAAAVGPQGEARGFLLEMCYHPSPNTAITRLATARDWHVISGTEAMIWQGLEQDRYWTGCDVSEMPVEEVKAAVAEALERARAHI
jgi:quinate dehydrogenase